MPKPVCLPCAREMLCTRVGARIEFTRREGKAQRDYQVFSADVYKCSGCGAEVAARYASHPLWEHFYSEPKPENILATVRE